jgi:hypothetical protein
MVQMPALNTPQFDWCLTRLPHHPQPVPPIFEPEVAARAIYWAAHHKRRELYVGASTVEAVVGNKIAPGILDAYLGKTGYQAQQTSEPVNPDRKVNMFEPVPGDHGARGRFADKASSRSIQLMADTHRGLLALVGLGLAGAAAAFWESRR